MGLRLQTSHPEGRRQWGYWWKGIVMYQGQYCIRPVTMPHGMVEHSEFIPYRDGCPDQP